jgi:hypothetical protein
LGDLVAKLRLDEPAEDDVAVPIELLRDSLSESSVSQPRLFRFVILVAFLLYFLFLFRFFLPCFAICKVRILMLFVIINS